MISMFQVIVLYLSRRFFRFFSEKPVEKYDDLIQRVKAAMPYIRNVPDSKIRVAYKDVKLGVYCNCSTRQFLYIVLREAFRNAYDCGSVTFRRLELDVREIDSPFIAKSKHRETKESQNVNTSTATATSTINYTSVANSLKENTSATNTSKRHKQ